MAAEKFETSLKKLEEIVSKLEKGTLSLDGSIKAFEEGVKHASFCANKLNEAEQKVELLIKQRDNSFRREPFASASVADETER
ncbi:MAG: exodeoxyribonuclease VII small subunit [Trichlorobacter sp.]|nr:exodeoxyribonuclease VII small subunit [Trichlorobacter sp.]